MIRVKRKSVLRTEMFLCITSLILFSVLIGGYIRNGNVSGSSNEIYFKLLGQVYEINLQLEQTDERYPNEERLSAILKTICQMGVAQADALGVDMKKVSELLMTASKNREYIRKLRALCEEITAVYDSGTDCEEILSDYLYRVSQLPRELAADLKEETLKLKQMLQTTLEKKRKQGDEIAGRIEAFFAEHTILHTALESALNVFAQQAGDLAKYSERLTEAISKVERARLTIARIERDVSAITEGVNYLQTHYYSGSENEILELRKRIESINEIDRGREELTRAIAILKQTERKVKVARDTMDRIRSYVNGLKSYEPEEISIRNLDYIEGYLSFARELDVRDQAALTDEVDYLISMKAYLETRGYAEGG